MLRSINKLLKLLY